MAIPFRRGDAEQAITGSLTRRAVDAVVALGQRKQTTAPKPASIGRAKTASARRFGLKAPLPRHRVAADRLASHVIEHAS